MEQKDPWRFLDTFWFWAGFFILGMAITFRYGIPEKWTSIGLMVFFLVLAYGVHHLRGKHAPESFWWMRLEYALSFIALVFFQAMAWILY